MPLLIEGFRTGGAAAVLDASVVIKRRKRGLPPAALVEGLFAWFRRNVLLYNLLAAFQRVALPEQLPSARPKRLRLVLLNGVGKVIRHARETVLRLIGAARLALATGPPRARPA